MEARRWIWGTLAVIGLFLLVGVLAPASPGTDSGGIPGEPETGPEGRVSNLPEADLEPEENLAKTDDPDEIIAKVRISDQEYPSVTYREIRVTPDGSVFVDAEWAGEPSEKPGGASGWNQLARAVANDIARDHAPNRAVTVRIYDGEDLVSQVSTRAGG